MPSLPSIDRSDCDRKIANYFIAKLVPLIIAGISIYACWVYTRVLCVDWLINPPHDLDPRYPEPHPATAIGLLVLYYVIFTPYILTYATVFIRVVWSPDYVPYGAEYYVAEKEAAGQSGDQLETAASSGVANRRGNTGRRVKEGNNATARSYPRDPEGHEAFYLKDVYTCLDDGKPAWCTTCCQFKTDRTHHSREANRCVRKMDHFCPWVGGVVSESSMKPFVQFLFYALLYVLVNFIVFVIYTVQRHRAIGGYTVHFIVGIGFASFLGLFVGAMFFSTTWNALHNVTTIEAIRRKTKDYTLAIYAPPTCKWMTESPAPNSNTPLPLNLITFPNDIDPRFSLSNMPQLQYQRTFAIVRTQPGDSPFDLGSPYANFKELMGYRLWEWFTPWTRSPCQDHSHPECGYRLGPVIDRLRKEYGLEPVPGRQTVEMAYAPPAPAPAPAAESAPVTVPVPIPGSDAGAAGTDPSVSGAATTDSSLVANISTREHSYHNNHHARSSSRHRPQSTSSSISGSSASRGQTSSGGAGSVSLN